MLSALSVSQEMSLPASPSSILLSTMALSSPGHPETNAGSSKHPTGTGRVPRGHTEMRNNSPNQPLKEKKEEEAASQQAMLFSALFSCASLSRSQKPGRCQPSGDGEYI